MTNHEHRHSHEQVETPEAEGLAPSREALQRRVRTALEWYDSIDFAANRGRGIIFIPGDRVIDFPDFMFQFGKALREKTKRCVIHVQLSMDSNGNVNEQDALQQIKAQLIRELQLKRYSLGRSKTHIEDKKVIDKLSNSIRGAKTIEQVQYECNWLANLSEYIGTGAPYKPIICMDDSLLRTTDTQQHNALFEMMKQRLNFFISSHRSRATSFETSIIYRAPLSVYHDNFYTNSFDYRKEGAHRVDSLSQLDSEDVRSLIQENFPQLEQNAEYNRIQQELLYWGCESEQLTLVLLQLWAPLLQANASFDTVFQKTQRKVLTIVHRSVKHVESILLIDKKQKVLMSHLAIHPYFGRKRVEEIAQQLGLIEENATDLAKIKYVNELIDKDIIVEDHNLGAWTLNHSLRLLYCRYTELKLPLEFKEAHREEAQYYANLPLETKACFGLKHYLYHQCSALLADGTSVDKENLATLLHTAMSWYIRSEDLLWVEAKTEEYRLDGNGREGMARAELSNLPLIGSMMPFSKYNQKVLLNLEASYFNTVKNPALWFDNAMHHPWRLLQPREQIAKKFYFEDTGELKTASGHRWNDLTNLRSLLMERCSINIDTLFQFMIEIDTFLQKGINGIMEGYIRRYGRNPLWEDMPAAFEVFYSQGENIGNNDLLAFMRSTRISTHIGTAMTRTATESQTIDMYRMTLDEKLILSFRKTFIRHFAESMVTDDVLLHMDLALG